jgi:hypothetical protein
LFLLSCLLVLFVCEEGRRNKRMRRKCSEAEGAEHQKKISPINLIDELINSPMEYIGSLCGFSLLCFLFAFLKRRTKKRESRRRE